MSTAGHIFRQQVKSVNETAAGSKSLTFDIENDGFLLTIERLSGTGSITGSIYSELPNPMSEVKLVDIATVSDDDPHQYAYVSHRRVRFDVSWDDAAEFRILVKAMSGEGIAEFNAGQGGDDNVVNDPTIANVAMAVAGTEYSYALPSGTKRFRIWSRKQSRLQVSYTSGDTGTIYMTVPAGCDYVEHWLAPNSSVTIYARGIYSSDTLEVTSWKYT